MRKTADIANVMKQKGFALPTVLIASVIMLTVLSSALVATTAVRTSLKSQYYDQLSKLASEAGERYAQACLDANSGAPQWSDSDPLKPDTDCSGIQLASCPVDPADADCHSVMKTDNLKLTFSVAEPDLDTNGKAINIRSSGSTDLLRDTDGTVWRTYSQNTYEQYDAAAYVEVLVVAGGGGGGAVYYGGGGGGGGVVYASDYKVRFGESISVSVGAGGAGGVHPNRADNGVDSTFGTMTAVGGGGGGTYDAGTGVDGGSGGGASTNGSATATGGTATQADSGGGTGYGNNGGGSYYGTGYNSVGGGGGGAGAVGQDGAADSGGNGGSGYQSSMSGVSVYYGGGGGAGAYAITTSGGNGGGANGKTSGTGNSGTSNTGGGGGGTNGGVSNNGGNGGSGVVIVSYRNGTVSATGGTITYTDSNNANPRSGTPYSGGYTIHTFNSDGSFDIS